MVRERERGDMQMIPCSSLSPSVDLCSFLCNEIKNDPRLPHFLSEALSSAPLASCSVADLYDLKHFELRLNPIFCSH